MKISFVIPCYRSQDTIEFVVEEIEKVMFNKDYLYEIILVDDCSPDRVWEKIVQLSRRDNAIHGVRLVRNFGQACALMAGYSYATGDYVVSLDDDGQSPVENLFVLLNRMKEENLDVVFATTPIRKESLFRRIGSKINCWMTEKLIGMPKGLWVTSFFVMSRLVVDEIIKYRNAYPYIEGLILRVTKNVGGIDVQQHERIKGKSGYTLRKLIGLWLNGFTTFSIVPLRVATFCGIFCAFIGFFGGVFLFIKKIVDTSIQMGYSSIMCAMLFMGGMIMLMLGIIGEYIGRTYISVNCAPQFIVRTVTKSNGIGLEKNEKKCYKG